jgi:hypothetical protein
MSNWNLPPNVTLADIEAQTGDNMYCEMQELFDIYMGDNDSCECGHQSFRICREQLLYDATIIILNDGSRSIRFDDESQPDWTIGMCEGCGKMFVLDDPYGMCNDIQDGI